MGQGPLSPRLDPSASSSHGNYQQITPFNEVELEEPPPYTAGTYPTSKAHATATESRQGRSPGIISTGGVPPQGRERSQHPRYGVHTPNEPKPGSQLEGGYVPEPAMSTANSEPNPWAKYDTMAGACFSKQGGCCFSRRGGCCFSDTEGCCFSKNKGCCFSTNGGCCFSSGVVGALLSMCYLLSISRYILILIC